MLTEQNGQTPTIENLAEYMNLSRKRVLEIASACKAITSLHVTIDEKDEMYLIDAIESEKISDTFESSFNRKMKEVISNALDKLESREAMVLKLRFGLDDGKPHTLRDISNYFGITRERIRQIQNKAMEKLKNFRMIQEHHYHYN